MASIRLLVDTLLDDPSLDEQRVREYLELMAKENKRLSRLIDNFLAFSRMERNHYYASHCTCATKLYGSTGTELPYLLRRFAHTNEGSCAIQVFWKPDDPVTMVRYHPGEEPALDVYAGKVVQSHPMPPAAGHRRQAAQVVD